MSYGAYVNACIEQRTRQQAGTTDRDHARLKRADDFANYPERDVLEVLRELRYPERQVDHATVVRRLRERVSPERRRAWLLGDDDA